MEKKKRLVISLILISVLVFCGPCVAGAESKEAIRLSPPVCSGPQLISSISVVSDSPAFGSSQGSIEWKMGWNLVDGSWYYSDSLNPVSLRSGWLYTGGAWYWLDPSTHAMATGVQQISGVQYTFASNGAWLG